MKCPFSIACLVFLLVSGGCGSTRIEPTHFSFPFVYDGLEYHIISVVSSEDGGHNYLTHREGGQIVFSAKDANQDGVLDTVVIGDFSLALANEIYLTGLGQARDRGKYRELPGARTFEYSQLGHTLMVRTITPDNGRIYNVFIHFDTHGNELVGTDDDADGKLDRITKGGTNLGTSQEQYRMVLDEGVRLGRIQITNKRYEVKSR